MAELPEGTVTFLLTDVEGSTRRWEDDPDGMKKAVAALDELVGAAVASHGGVLLKSRGEGDSHFCVFARASDAVAAATELARAAPLPTRVALHTGEAELRDADYFGPTVNRAARLRAIGHGGQILISRATAELVRGASADGWELRDLGLHRLRDLAEPEHVFEMSMTGASPYPALASLDSARHNLPSQLTTFVGREREQADITSKLSGSRLVTLTGSGGSGKTRLALQVAAELVDDFADGAWLIDLAPVIDPASVVPTAAAAFDLRLDDSIATPTAMRDRLVAVLRERELLIVLDNCEHLIEESADLVLTLLTACPAVKVIATSREALGLSGETIWLVPSLEPREAANLFAERASLKRASAIGPDDGPAVDQICAQLDGIPLAIELAAAKTNILSPSQIATKLEDRFRLLTGGGRTSIARQQTLLATLDWSHGLLTDQERAVLRRLAVFVGGFSLDAAEVVCAGDGVDASDVLDVVGHLADKSLIQVDTERSEPRYRLLETVRQYATNKLVDADEVDDSRSRHQEWYVEFARESNLGIRGVDDAAWIDRITIEIDNLRAAIRWGGARGLRIAADLARYWLEHGPAGEGIDQLRSLIGCCPDDDPLLRAEAEVALGELLGVASGSHECRPHLEAAIAAAAGLSGERALSATATALGVLAADKGSSEGPGSAAVKAELQAALDAAERGAASWVVLSARLRLASSQVFGGDQDQARQLIAQIEPWLADHGTSLTCRSLLVAADLAVIDHRDSDADALLVRAGQMADAAGLTALRCSVGARRGALAHAAGRKSEARDVLGNAVEIGHLAGNWVQRSIATTFLAKTLVSAGRIDDALEHLRLEVERARAEGSEGSEQEGGLGGALVDLGRTMIVAGRLGEAREALEEAHARSAAQDHHTDSALALQQIGILDCLLGDLPSAARVQQDALRLVDGAPQFFVVEGVKAVASLALAAGDSTRAALLASASLQPRGSACCWSHLMTRLMDEDEGSTQGAEPPPSLDEALAEAGAVCRHILEAADANG